MKQILLISIGLLLSVSVFSDDSIQVAEPAADSISAEISRPKIIESMSENVQFYGDAAVLRLLKDREEGIVREEVQIQGYRVQVFSSNRQQTAKTEAFRIQKLIEKSSLETETYVLYNPPFWKVRLGNFRSHEEALLMKDEVIKTLPELQGDTYVVRDQITVLQ